MKGMEFSVAIVYFAICIAIALYFNRKAGKSQASYWSADHSIGFWVNGFAQFSALVSSASFLGFLGVAYRMGWSFSTITFAVGPTAGFITCMLLVSGPLRRYSEIRGKFTLSNFLADRYGNKTGLVSSIFILILFPAYIVPQLMGGGLAGAYVLGIDFKYAVILVGAIYVGYVLIGGMLSVTWTDFVQGILMFVFMVGLSLVAISHFGGLNELLPKAMETNKFFLNLPPPLPGSSLFGLAISVFMFTVASPHIIMRLFTAKNVNQGRASLVLTSGLALTFHVVGYLGVAAAALIIAPKLTNVDNTYIVVMDQLFHPVIRGFAVAGILAAIMSTTDAMLLATGAEFSNNLWGKYWKKDASDQNRIRVAQIVMLIVGVVTIVLALNQTKSIGIIVGLLVGATGSTFAVPLVAGLWWKRANNAGGFLSASGGFIVFAVVHYSKIVPMFAEILVALPVSFGLMIAGSLMTSAPSTDFTGFIDELHSSRPIPSRK